MAGDYWVMAIVGLEAGATMSYLLAGDLRQALVWAGVAVSNIAWLLVHRS